MKRDINGTVTPRLMKIKYFKGLDTLPMVFVPPEKMHFYVLIYSI